MSQGKGNVTISCRVSSAQDRLLEAFAQKFQQRKSDLIREALQLWINNQVEQRGMPEVQDAGSGGNIEVP